MEGGGGGGGEGWSERTWSHCQSLAVDVTGVLQQLDEKRKERLCVCVCAGVCVCVCGGVCVRSSVCVCGGVCVFLSSDACMCILYVYTVCVYCMHVCV